MSTEIHPPRPILIVDEERIILENISDILISRGINNILICSDSRKVIDILLEHEIEIILLDLIMPNMPGEVLLPEIVQNFPDIPVIILTGLNDIATAVKCMKAGASDYMVKAVEESRLIMGIKNAIAIRELKYEYSNLKRRFLKDLLENGDIFSQIITNNSKMRAIFKYIESISRTSHPVLITGETGTGKGLIAGIIHKLSGRDGNLVAANTSGLDDTMFTDTLFGHRRGAFTGASEVREGFVANASNGTLFLDEIADLSISSQTKLLRLLDEKEYFPLGSDVARKSETRIIAATNAPLTRLVAEGKFRKDLFYRLKIHEIEIPPLRERMDDLPLLIDHFLVQAANEVHRKKPTPPPELYQLLKTYDFPGNVRELKSMIQDAVSRHRGRVMSLDSFKAALGKREINPDSDQTESLVNFSARLPTLKQINMLLVEEALKRAEGNISIASTMLGISSQALGKRLKRLRQ